MVNRFLGQRVYVDSSVIIYATEVPNLFPNLRSLLIDPISRGEITLVTSCITLAEVLVKPIQNKNSTLGNTYRQFLTPSRFLEIAPVTLQISEQAAEIRALHGIKLPDALHIATGLAKNCSVFITGDAQWSKTGIPVIDVGNL